MWPRGEPRVVPMVTARPGSAPWSLFVLCGRWPQGLGQFVDDGVHLSLQRFGAGGAHDNGLELLIFPDAIVIPPGHEPGELDPYRYHEDTAVAMAAAWPAVSVSL